MPTKKSVAIVLAVLALVGFFLLLPCLQKVRNGAFGPISNKYKEVALAFHNYNEKTGHFPPAVVRNKAGKPLYSWRVLLLPYLEQEALYKEFRLDEPWDSPHNKTLLEKMPNIYKTWSVNDPVGTTRFQVLVGPGTFFERDNPTYREFEDRASETFLVVDAANPVPWTKPVDLAYEPGGPLPALGGQYAMPIHFLECKVGQRPGFFAAFADGSVRFIRSDTDEKAIRAMIAGR